MNYDEIKLSFKFIKYLSIGFFTYISSMILIFLIKKIRNKKIIIPQMIVHLTQKCSKTIVILNNLSFLKDNVTLKLLFTLKKKTLEMNFKMINFQE